MTIHYDTLAKIIAIIRPGAQYTYNEVAPGQFELIWHDAVLLQPSEAELLAAIPEVESLRYRELRAPEYPPLGDQLDALWKGGDAAVDMLAKIEAVKAKYPKP